MEVFDVLSMGTRVEKEHALDEMAQESDLRVREDIRQFRNLIEDLIKMIKVNPTLKRCRRYGTQKCEDPQRFYDDNVNNYLIMPANIMYYSPIIYEMLGLQVEENEDILMNINFFKLIYKNVVKSMN